MPSFHTHKNTQDIFLRLAIFTYEQLTCTKLISFLSFLPLPYIKRSVIFKYALYVKSNILFSAFLNCLKLETSFKCKHLPRNFLNHIISTYIHLK